MRGGQPPRWSPDGWPHSGDALQPRHGEGRRRGRGSGVLASFAPGRRSDSDVRNGQWWWSAVAWARHPALGAWHVGGPTSFSVSLHSHHWAGMPHDVVSRHLQPEPLLVGTWQEWKRLHIINITNMPQRLPRGGLLPNPGDQRPRLTSGAPYLLPQRILQLLGTRVGVCVGVSLLSQRAGETEVQGGSRPDPHPRPLSEP